MQKLKNENSKRRKQVSTLDKYLILSFVCLITYTIVEQISSSISGVSHDVLTTCFFAAFGGETLLCARIKKYKLSKEQKEIKKDEVDY